MTTVTLHLSDSLVKQAKQAGIYNEKTLADKLQEFLTLQLKQKIELKPNQSTVYDFVMGLPQADYVEDGLQIQHRLRDEW